MSLSCAQPLDKAPYEVRESIQDVLVAARRVCAVALGDFVISNGIVSAINDFLLRLEDERDLDLAIKFVNIAVHLSKNAAIIASKINEEVRLISEDEENFEMNYKYYTNLYYRVADYQYNVDRSAELVEFHSIAANEASLLGDFETTKREAIAACLAAEKICELTTQCINSRAVSLTGKGFYDSLSGAPLSEDIETFNGYIVTAEDYIFYNDICDITTAKRIANNIIKIASKIEVDVDAITSVAFKIVNYDDGLGVNPIRYCVESAEDTKNCAEDAKKAVFSAIKHATFVLESDETCSIIIVMEQLVLGIDAMKEANKLMNECGVFVCSSAAIVDLSL
jgi:hypothetical protein